MQTAALRFNPDRNEAPKNVGHLLAGLPPGGWAAVAFVEGRLRIIASGDSEEEARKAARATGYRIAVLVRATDEIS